MFNSYCVDTWHYNITYTHVMSNIFQPSMSHLFFQTSSVSSGDNYPPHLHLILAKSKPQIFLNIWLWNHSVLTNSPAVLPLPCHMLWKGAETASTPFTLLWESFIKLCMCVCISYHIWSTAEKNLKIIEKKVVEICSIFCHLNSQVVRTMSYYKKFGINFAWPSSFFKMYHSSYHQAW